MLAPKNLKIGDIFTDGYGNKYKVKGIIPFVGYDTENVTEITKEDVKIPEAKTEKDNADNYEEMSIKELQQLCKDKGLSYRGSKAQVIDRLRG